jgi:hypothetical protein
MKIPYSELEGRVVVGVAAIAVAQSMAGRLHCGADIGVDLQGAGYYLSFFKGERASARTTEHPGVFMA